MELRRLARRNYVDMANEGENVRRRRRLENVNIGDDSNGQFEFYICPWCGARKFDCESSKFCCSGRGELVGLPEVPDDLWTLLTSNGEMSKEYRKNIRVYNNLFCFTSLGL